VTKLRQKSAPAGRPVGESRNDPRVDVSTGFHNWWHAGDGEFVCIDCGHTQKGELRHIEPSRHVGSSHPLPWIVIAAMCVGRLFHN
jgi:hypothetical protein